MNIDPIKGLSVTLLLAAQMFICEAVFASCDRFNVDSVAEVVIDTSSGLSWARCREGQTVPGCDSAAGVFSWVDALNRARSSEHGGLTKWRLPKIEELTELHAALAECSQSTFPGIETATLWSASANLDFATDAWVFDFARGTPEIRSRDQGFQVLIVIKTGM